MKTRNFLKKMLAVILVFAMLAPIMGNLKVNLNHVQAAETTASSELLSVKCQVTQDVVTDTDIDKYRNNYVMRFVSSVDSLEYKEVGFTLSYTDENGKTVTKTNRTKTVFERIESTTGSTSKGRDTYSFSPKVISTDSKYFITAKLPVAPTDEAMATQYTVRAFARTSEGTVYGPARCVSVNDGLSTCKTINMSFENTNNVDLTNVTTLGVNDNDAYSASVIGVDDKTVHVRISGVDKSTLKSATSFTFKNGGTVVGSGIFRNLYTEYSGTADTSWYDVYKDDREAFVIATNADLYGLASIVDAGTTFEGKFVYLCSDIALNASDAVDWKNIDGKLTGKGTPYTWEPIGSTTYSSATQWTVQMKPFSGTFDGQNHTISGLYISGTSEYVALFGGTSANAVVKNFRLVDGFLKGGAATAGVAAEGNGLFENIYCNVTLQNTANSLGGLVARCYASGITIRNCWYAGQLLNKLNNWNNHVGGLIGHIDSTNVGNSIIDNCLMTGTVDAWKYCGGLIGTFNGTKMTISNSLCLGAKGETTPGMYSLIATAPTDTTKTVIISNAYALDTLGTSPKYTGTIYNDAGTEITDLATLQVTSANITGTSAITKLGYDFVNTWATVQGKTPILRSFEDLTTDIIVDISWYNDNDDTFVIYDRADMYGFASLVDNGTTFADKTVKLGADIRMNDGNASDWATTAPAYAWNPIGDAGAVNIFAGTFDGDGHTISGIYLKGTGWYNGLFAQTSTDAKIYNFKLTNSYIESTGAVLGGVTGYGKGTFEKIYSDAIVKSSNKVVGGIVGKADGSFSMLECWFDGTVVATGNAKDLRTTGGLIGEVANSCIVKYSLNSGTIDASAYKYDQDAGDATVVLPYVGGLIGTVTATSKNITIYATNLLNVGEVKYSGEATGGYGSIVGYIADGTTTAGKFSIGTSDISYATEESCKVTANKTFTSIQAVKEADLIGYFGYRGLPGFDFDTYWTVVVDDSTTPNIDETGTPILQSFAKDVPSLPDTSWYSASDNVGTATNPYKLYDRADLYGFAELVNGGNDFSGKTVVLANDIVMNTGNASDWATKAPVYTWTPMGSSTIPFAGTFDGDGHTISGLYMNSTSWYSGFFSETSTTAKICNFKLTNSYMSSSKRNFGSIVAIGRGTFEKIYSDAIIVSTEGNVGGLVGQSDSTFVMKECWFDGKVTAKGSGINARRTGGLIGLVSQSCEVKYCLNSGIIDASAYKNDQDAGDATVVLPCVGGLIGNVASGKTIFATQLLNVGEVKYNSIATGGYGSVAGYIDGTGNFSSGSTDYIYATEESCSVITNITYTHMKQIPKANLMGYDGYRLLPGFEFDKYWAIVVDDVTTTVVDESGTPILKAFAQDVSNNIAENALQKTVRSNSLMNVTLSNGVTMNTASVYQTDLAQGGCIVGDYYYQLLLSYKDADTARILKYKLADGSTESSPALKLGHANDMTYNSKTNQLLISHSSGLNVSIINLDKNIQDLTDDDVYTFEWDIAIYSIAYNATRDQYVVGISGGTQLRVFDSDFEEVYKFATNADFHEYTTQGIECDDKYIYCAYDEKDTIAVYDWLGNYVSRINLQYNSTIGSLFLEPENISVVDDKIYIVIANKSDRINTYLYTIPVNTLTASTATE